MVKIYEFIGLLRVWKIGFILEEKCGVWNGKVFKNFVYCLYIDGINKKCLLIMNLFILIYRYLCFFLLKVFLLILYIVISIYICIYYYNICI